MSLKLLNGDLLQLANDGHFDVIIHGCNCFHTMGAGIAAQVKRKFPKAFSADLQTQKGSRDKLGHYSYSIEDNLRGGKFVIVNAYTQFNFANSDTHNEVLLDYPALENILEDLGKDFKGYKMGFPLIGCGRAGGDEKKVVSMIGEVLKNEDVTIVKFEQ